MWNENFRNEISDNFFTLPISKKIKCGKRKK